VFYYPFTLLGAPVVVSKHVALSHSAAAARGGCAERSWCVCCAAAAAAPSLTPR